jgi:hypothetical protein
MRPAKEHADRRNWMETIVRHIPGFRGYLEKEYRRESDELQRNWLAGRLQQSKKGLDEYMQNLTAAGNLDALPTIERVRMRLDKIRSRITSAMQGYSGVFDLVRIDEAVLDRVYEHDANLVDEVETLADTVEALPGKTEPPATLAADVLKQIEALEEAWDQREDILKGME